MDPTRRGSVLIKEDVGGNQAAIGTRKSARLIEAARESNEDLVVKQEVEADAEQPERPMSFPLELDSHYVCTRPGELLLKDVEVAKVKTTLIEKKNVLQALGLVLQALRALELGPIPDLPDRNHDIVWDWRSMELSANEYGAFAYAVIQYKETLDILDGVSYDWTPLDSSRGILSIRKKYSFQSQITRILASVIVEAMWDNELLRSLVGYKELEPQMRASVLTGTVEGLRTPCRCFRFQPKEKEEARPLDNIQDFVLEVGIGKKNQVLPELAYSYIERGTLCVMTVSIKRQGEYDFDWSYSLYRRGEARRLPGQVTKYEVVCAVQDARVKVKKNEVEFPAGLTLFDFIPPNVLEKHGVTRRHDKKAIVKMEMSLSELDETKGNLPLDLSTGKSISQHLQSLDKLLRK